MPETPTLAVAGRVYSGLHPVLNRLVYKDERSAWERGKNLLYEQWNADDTDSADLHGFLPVESGAGSYGCMNAGAVAESFAIRGLKQERRNLRNRLYVLSVFIRRIRVIRVPFFI